MFKLYSKGCEYAMRALVYAAQQDTESGTRFQIGDVCDKLDIPEYFTRKVFQALVQGGFLDAVRGPSGGYMLNRPAEEINLIEIIQAVDGSTTFDQCVMGLPQCDGKKPCPLHEVWTSAKTNLLDQLKQKTLRDIVEVAKAGQKKKR